MKMYRAKSAHTSYSLEETTSYFPSKPSYTYTQPRLVYEVPSGCISKLVKVEVVSRASGWAENGGSGKSYDESSEVPNGHHFFFKINDSNNSGSNRWFSDFSSLQELPVYLNSGDRIYHGVSYVNWTSLSTASSVGKTLNIEISVNMCFIEEYND